MRRSGWIWMQQWVWSSFVEGLAQQSNNKDCSNSKPSHCVNQKGICKEVSIWDNASSNNATSSLKSCMHYMGLLPHPHEMTEWESGCLEPSVLLWQCSFASPCKDRGLYLLTVVMYAEFAENMSNNIGAKAFPSFARTKIWKCAWVLILMIYIGSGLLMHHLQTHPSWQSSPWKKVICPKEVSLTTT